MQPRPSSTGGQRRALTALLAVLAGTVLLWVAGSQPARPQSLRASFELSPTRGLPGTEVSVTGYCKSSPYPTGSPASPSSIRAMPTVESLMIRLLLDGEEQGLASLNTVTGAFEGSFTVPLGTLPGTHRVTTEPPCGEANFEVLERTTPTLTLDPVRSAVPAEVTATGTCPPARRGVVISLDGEQLATVSPDAGTGAFGPVRLHLPGDLSPGSHDVTSSCGASATFTVLAAPKTTPPTTPSTSTPTPSLVEVPDIVGKTAADALTALGDQLHLANRPDGNRHIISQDPSAGSFVPAGSVVTVAWERPVSGGGLSLWLPAAGLLAVLAAAALIWRLERARRARRWCERHVETAPFLGGPSVDAGTSGVRVPAHRVRLEVHRDADHSGGAQ